MIQVKFTNMEVNFKREEELFNLSGVLEVSDEVVPVLLLLKAGEHHLGAGDVLLGVRQVDV